MTGEKITIHAKYPNIQLYSNGKKTHLMTEGDFNHAKVDFYPLTNQKQQIYGEMQLPWGKARTNVIAVDLNESNASYEFSLNPLINHQIEHSLTQEIERLARAIESVYNHRSARPLKQVTFSTYNLFSGENNSLLTYLENLVSTNSIKGGTLKSVEIFRLPKLDEKNQLILPIHLTWSQNRDEGAKEEEAFYEVSFKYQKNKWQVVHVHELAEYPLDYQEQQSIVKKY